MVSGEARGVEDGDALLLEAAEEGGVHALHLRRGGDQHAPEVVMYRRQRVRAACTGTGTSGGGAYWTHLVGPKADGSPGV